MLYAINLSLLIILKVCLNEQNYYTSDGPKVKSGTTFGLAGSAGVTSQAGAEERRRAEQEEQCERQAAQ